MANAIGSCVHCGFCLPTCPTYVTMGEEMDSPRGRIFLMKEVLEGNLELEQAQPYVDHCLGCLACVTSCPSGVEYGNLISPFRAYAEKHRKKSIFRCMFRLMLLESLPFPGRFRFMARLGALALPFKKLAPKALQPSLDLLPPSLPESQPLPEVYPAKGEQRARVALLAGCAQQVLAPNINWATLRVLSENGVEVVIPKDQACCGALAMHVGEDERARTTARKNLTAFKGYDAVLTNAAGCGSGMHEYTLLFKGQPEEAEAKELVKKCKDVSVFLDELGLKEPPPLAEPMKLAYHDACHLAHAQAVRTPPRQLLKAIPNLTLLEPMEWEVCCGSAGTYNIEQPETADQLGERKAGNLIATGAEAVATGNIGCLTQIQHHFGKKDSALPVYHTMEVLDMAYRRKGG